MHYAVADQFCRCARIFLERERERAQRVKTRTWLWITRLPILQHGIEIYRRANGRKRARPTPPHRIRHAGANGGSFMRGLFLDLVQEILEILNRDASACASAHDPGQVRRC